MYLRAAAVCQDVCVHVPLHELLFHVVSKSGDDDVIVAFHLTIGLWEVGRGRRVPNPKDLANMLKET